MGSFSLWHWLIVLLIIVIIYYPIYKIIRRAGFSGWWVLVSFVPVVNVIAIWFFAFCKWPNLNEN
jgi:hypothetical protein